MKLSGLTRLQYLLLFLVASPAEATVLQVNLNQLQIGIDERSGSIVSIRSRDSGQSLVAVPEYAGLLDVAYPVESFAAMRLASRFSRAKIARKQNGVVISWERLGASRSNLPVPAGNVRAEVTIRAADDGRSVIFSSRIENHSDATVPQILFPDLWGLKPVAGVENTRLRFARGTTTPFDEPLKPEGSADWYARPWPGSGAAGVWNQATAGGYYVENSLRWLDFGGYRGGLSVFQKKWGTWDWPNVITQRTERDPMSLRLAWEHRHAIEPGENWSSGEFWFTPHAGGWAKGIEVYRNYVTEVNPPKQLPRHVEEDLAFQTIWMIQQVEVDPAKAAFKFDDLLRIAQDAKRHGIHELVLFGWCAYYDFPITVRSELGDTGDLIEGIEQARAIGVNITPMFSVTVMLNKFAERYGVELDDDDDHTNYTYHYEFIPTHAPYYTSGWDTVRVNSNNVVWQNDVAAEMKRWVGNGITSIGWDVYGFDPIDESGMESPMLVLTRELRNLARAKYAESTFMGESVTHLELDSPGLDYLWNWTDYKDAGPIVNLLKTPRPNCNVEDSPLTVTKCFADNIYINAMPRKLHYPVNGSALISDEPELATALLHANKLRKQFLPFFVNGTFIGDSVLDQPANAFVRSYQLADRMLVIVLNDRGQTQHVNIESDLSLWLPSAKSYRITTYDNAGQKLGSTEVQESHWFGSTPALASGQLAFFEIES